jgi:hypothetical protein
VLFCVYHWYLAVKGKTTLEFCFNDSRYTPDKSWINNLEIIFGTRNLFRIFLPQLTITKSKGFEWDNLIQRKHDHLASDEIPIK